MNSNQLGADWSNMLVDILDRIAVKLITFEDMLAFSTVCHSWYSAYTRAKNRWSPRMPWLMFPENTEDNPRRLPNFFDPSTSKRYRLNLPNTFLCWGSAYGWIICVDFKFNTFMFNPLTKARLELPSVHTLPFPLVCGWVDEADPFLEVIRQACGTVLGRFILLKTPPSREEVEEEFLAVSFITIDLVDIAIAKPNDSAWTPILVEDNIRGGILDIAYWNDGLLLLDHEGAIYRVGLNHGAANNESLTATYYSPPFGAVLNDPVPLDRLYLTESSGNLLAVWRFNGMGKVEVSEDRDPVYDTHGFYLLKFNDEAREWEHVKDLEGNSIFVGSNSTMAVQACESINCRRNCIYFTDDLRPHYRGPERHGIGVFRIDDNSGKDGFSSIFKPLCLGKRSRFPHGYPQWFLPQL